MVSGQHTQMYKTEQVAPVFFQILSLRSKLRWQSCCPHTPSLSTFLKCLHRPSVTARYILFKSFYQTDADNWNIKMKSMGSFFCNKILFNDNAHLLHSSTKEEHYQRLYMWCTHLPSQESGPIRWRRSWWMSLSTLPMSSTLNQM